MNRHHFKIALSACFCLAGALVSPAAHAAEPAFISKIGGKGVSILRGTERLSVQVQTLLESGDRVTAPEGSFVEVTYMSDGCVLRAAKGRSILVSDVSPCEAAAPADPGNSTQTAAAGPGQPEVKVVPAAAETDTARVTDFTGPLARVNFGQGLVDIKSGMVLKPGDTVFAGQSSTVTLYFPDPRCSYTLAAETYLQISTVPPCRPSGEAAAPETSTSPSPPAADNDLGLAIGAVALVGGGAAVAAVVLMGGGRRRRQWRWHPGNS